MTKPFLFMSKGLHACFGSSFKRDSVCAFAREYTTRGHKILSAPTHITASASSARSSKAPAVTASPPDAHAVERVTL